MKLRGVPFLRRFAPSYGPHYGVAAQGCLRGMGLIYVISFWSLAAQISALSGNGGLLPAEWILQTAKAQAGTAAWYLLPGLAWFGSGSLFLLSISLLGALAGLCLLYGFYPWTAALVSWICWVSLSQVCQPWMSGAGDLLTAEAGLILLLLVSPRVRFYPSPNRMGSRITGIVLLNGLLFKVLFSSGLAKLLEGSPSWGSGKALYRFFETQPLPTVPAWYAHHLPETLLKYALWGIMFLQLIFPFYLFLPRTFRNIAAGGVCLEAMLLLLTGNHGFLPLLLLLLAFSLVDDVSWRRILPSSWGPSAAISYYQPRLPAIICLGTMLSLFIFQIQANIGPEIPMPWRPVENVLGTVRSTGRYGLFRQVPEERRELSIQGSRDGRTWVEYRFRFKPTDPKSLEQVSPLHFPRLDEAFVRLSSSLNPEQPPAPPVWLFRLMEQLLRNDPQTLSLFPVNPFPDAPPEFLRLAVYRYSYADPVTRREQQLWWRREFMGFYGPVFRAGIPAAPTVSPPAQLPAFPE